MTNSLTCRVPRITIIDDDESVRESLPELLREMGYCVQAFASAEEFLTTATAADCRILILDVTMPGMSGLDLQDELSARGDSARIIFMTAHANERIRQRVLGTGAVACLFKPFTETDLVAALGRAMASD